MGVIQGLLALLGRIMIAAIFLLSAVGNKIPKFNDVAGRMAAEGVPQPKILLAGAIALAGCTTTKIDERRVTSASVSSGDAVVVLGRRHSSFARTTRRIGAHSFRCGGA